MIKILVVDDEQDVQMLYQQKFRKEVRAGEFEFHFEYSGEAALEYLRNHGRDDVVLLLSDINMPGMSGLDLLKQTKEKFSHLKVIMVTAYNDESNYNTAVAYGSDDYFTKPVDFASLKSKLLNLSAL